MNTVGSVETFLGLLFDILSIKMVTKMLYDVFISHSSEDKDSFVRPLAQLLRNHRVEVWYDEFSLRPGDSLRRSIDRGLAKSRYGIVVLSPNFFMKNWTQWELDGLILRQLSGNQQVILPIWHNVDVKDVAAFSPSLADKIAINSNDGLEAVVNKLLEVIRPEGSTLLIARDIVIDYGYEPPVVTDDWWLDVVEVSASNDVEGTFQEAMGWGRWGFPLPPKDTSPIKRGERLAWAAMQMMWQKHADKFGICQITSPEQVHKFIKSQPGLLEACRRNLIYLLAYAPQLIIPGFGGEFEEDIEAIYQSQLSREGTHPCTELFALRHPDFGKWEADWVACEFVQGDAVRFGPPVKYYAVIDYIAWLLSIKSSWMPQQIRQFLLVGLKEWAVWDSDWGYKIETMGVKLYRDYGALSRSLYRVDSIERFKLTKTAKRDLESRLEISSHLLGLPESGSALAQIFFDNEFIPAWFQCRQRHNRKNGNKNQ